jgi:hypothetical protein
MGNLPLPCSGRVTVSRSPGVPRAKRRDFRVTSGEEWRGERVEEQRGERVEERRGERVEEQRGIA